MPDFSERPTKDFLDLHQKHLEDIWTASRVNWASTDSFRQLSYNIWTGPNAAAHANQRGQYRPPTPRTIIDHSADQFMALVPTVHREPLNADSDAHRVSADAVESAGKAILMDAGMHAMVNPWRLLGKHFNAYGYGLIELDVDLACERSRAPYWNPIRISATNPGRVLIDPLEKAPNAAIKTWKATAIDVDALMKSKRNLKYKGEFDLSNRNPWDMVELVSHWTGKNGWLTVREAGGEVLYQQKNMWGFVPFAHAFAGYGMEPVELDKNDPQYMAEGLLDGIKGTLRVQAQSQTAKHSMVMEEAFNPMGTSRDPEELVTAIEQGSILQGMPEEYWKLRLSDIPRWVFESGREVDEYIDRSVGSSARGGMRQPGVDTVGQQAILNNQMRRKFIGPSMQQEHIASIVLSWVLRLVDNLSVLKEGIGAHGNHLKRSDIKGNYDISVSFDVMDPVMEMQKRSMYLQEWQLGLLDDEGYWALTGVQNITKRREALNRQRVRNSPALIARTAQITAEAMDDMDAEDVQAVVSEISGGAMPPMAGMGGGGGGGEDAEAAAVAAMMGMGGGGAPGMNGGGAAQPPMRQPLDEQTAKPERIDLDRFVT